MLWIAALFAFDLQEREKISSSHGMEIHTKQKRTQEDLGFSFISRFMSSQDDTLCP